MTNTLRLLGCLTALLLPVSTAICQIQTIDFEGLTEGEIVSTVVADSGYGDIQILGQHQSCPVPNAAVVFDSTCPGGCSGNDLDLGAPNETLGGPGEGAAGEAGAPFENNMALGNILIVHSNCRDLSASPVADPNDYGGNWKMWMDFPTPVTMLAFSVLDVETDESMLVTLYDELGDSLQTVSVPATGDNGYAQVQLPDPVPGVVQIGIDRKGSGAIDNIVFNPATADLRVTKTVDVAERNVGDLAVFQIFVANDGPDDATNVVVEDRLGLGLSLENFDIVGSGNAIVDSAGVTFEIGGIAAGDSVGLVVVALVDSVGTLVNVAEIVGVDQEDPDSTPGNDNPDEDDQDDATLEALDLAGTADLRLRKEASTLTPAVGENMTFTVTLANDGPETATGVIVVDTLMVGFTFVQQSGTFHNFDEIGRVLGARMDSLVAGDSAQWVIEVRVDSSGTLTNIAEVFAGEQPDPDSTPRNGEVEEDDIGMVIITPSGKAERKYYKLLQNFPNPFNPYTNIAFNLDKPTHVEITVFDILGRKQLTLLNGPLHAGQHMVKLDATHLPSGIYLYRLKTPDGVVTRRMSLLK